MTPGLRAVPNPAHGWTALQFRLKQAGRVSCRIYDAGGRQVATLLDRELPAGSHSLSWSAADIPTGVYIGELMTGGARRSVRITRAQ